MEWLVKFEILNSELVSPFSLSKPCPNRFPEIDEVSIFPYPNNSELISEIRRDNQPRKTGTVVCIGQKSDRNPLAIAVKLVEPLCMLLGLAQRKDVWYWGASHYRRTADEWNVQHEEWGFPIAENCMGFLGSMIPRQHLETYSRLSLNAIDNPQFPVEDFMTSAFFLQESYRRSSIIEPMFVDAWIGFELLVNELAPRKQIDTIMGGARFKKFVKKLQDWMQGNPSLPLEELERQQITEKLPELNRVALKQLISDLLIAYGVDCDLNMAVELKKFRDRLFHSGKQGLKPEIPEVETAMKMQRLLESTHLGMLKASHVGSSPWIGGPEPSWEFPGVNPDRSNEHSTCIEGEVREKDGRVLTKGSMKVDWGPRKILVSGSTEDRAIMVAGNSGPGCTVSGLSVTNERVTVDVAYTSFYKHPQFQLSGLKIQVDSRPKMEASSAGAQ